MPDLPTLPTPLQAFTAGSVLCGLYCGLAVLSGNYLDAVSAGLTSIAAAVVAVAVRRGRRG